MLCGWPNVIAALFTILFAAGPTAAIERNVAGQKLTLQVIDRSTGGPKTGDAANLTAYVSIDGDTTPDALTDTSATELSSTNLPGVYQFDLTQAETNGANIVYGGKSSTANTDVVARHIDTMPANFGLAAIDSSGRVDADVQQFGGANGTFSGGRPEVNVSHISGDQAAADNAEKFFDGTGYGAHVARWTVDAVTAPNTIRLANILPGSLGDDAIVGSTLVIRDANQYDEFFVATVLEYDELVPHILYSSEGSPGFTVAAGDIVEILPPGFANSDRNQLYSAEAAVDNEVGAIKAKTDLLPTVAAGASGGLFIAGTNAQTTVTSGFGTGTITRGSFAADTGLQSIRSSTAQTDAAQTSTSIKLDASASGTPGFYKHNYIYLTGGTGIGQYRLITAYDGTSKVATITPAWATNPDGTSTFAILPAAIADVAAWLGTPALAPTVPGVPVVDITYVLGDPVCD